MFDIECLENRPIRKAVKPKSARLARLRQGEGGRNILA